MVVALLMLLLRIGLMLYVVEYGVSCGNVIMVVFMLQIQVVSMQLPVALSLFVLVVIVLSM